LQEPYLKIGDSQIFFWDGWISKPHPRFLHAFFYNFKFKTMLPIRTSGRGQHSKRAMKLMCMPGIFHFVQSNVISKLDVTVTLFEVPLGHIVEKGTKCSFILGQPKRMEWDRGPDRII